MTTQTTTPTKLQNPIPSRPMATTIAQADLVIRTVAGFAGSGDSNEILHNILITPHKDHVVIAATDKYRLASAKVSKDLWTGDNDKPSLISVSDLDGGAWVKALEIAVPQGDKRYPNVEQFINRTGHSTFSANVTPLHKGGYASNNPDVENLKKWAYWDGERRRPAGLVELLHTDFQVKYRLGLMLKGDTRMPDAMLWDKAIRPLADIVPTVPSAQGIGSDVKTQTLGVYNSSYLPNWQYVDTIRYQGPCTPLYLASGVFEFIVMPITS